MAIAKRSAPNGCGPTTRRLLNNRTKTPICSSDVETLRCFDPGVCGHSRGSPVFTPRPTIPSRQGATIKGATTTRRPAPPVSPRDAAFLRPETRTGWGKRRPVRLCCTASDALVTATSIGRAPARQIKDRRGGKGILGRRQKADHRGRLTQFQHPATRHLGQDYLQKLGVLA